ncbi:MAG: hypothetical protein K6E21_05720 [Bacilli bacterium]|nr:hypothetical protein [Bacilli bacterium]
MRKQRFEWSFVVLGLVLTIYGGYSLIYNYANDKDIPGLGIAFLIVGVALLLLYFALFAISWFQKKRIVPNQEQLSEQPPMEETTTEEVEKPIEEETVEEEITENSKDDYDSSYEKYTPRERIAYQRNKSIYHSDDGSGYVKKVGYGSVLRIENNRILDMRTNTYYSIEGNIVSELGSGSVFEISGNRIKSTFGGYLYEISGNNVNKVYGGFYASFNGNYLQTNDLEYVYEISCSLNSKQRLVVVALLFGCY